MKFPIAFRDHLKTLRELRELSRAQLDERARLSRGVISRMESGELRPSLATCERIAAALGLSLAELLDGTDLLHPPVPAPEWLSGFASPPPWRRPEWTIERRIRSVLTTYREVAERTLRSLDSHPYGPQLLALFRDFWVDSNLEAVFWLRLALDAQPHWLSPLECNLRSHPIVCPFTGLCVGDRPHPCLITTRPFRAIWFPQLTLLAAGHRQRLDGLVAVGHSRAMVVHIDGDGHRGTFDLARERALSLPVVRFSTKDVLDRPILPRLIQAREIALAA